MLDPRYKEKTQALEENNSRYPEIKLRGMGKNTKSVNELTINDVGKDSCKSGYCMVWSVTVYHAKMAHTKTDSVPIVATAHMRHMRNEY